VALPISRFMAEKSLNLNLRVVVTSTTLVADVTINSLVAWRLLFVIIVGSKHDFRSCLRAVQLQFRSDV